MNSIFKPLLRKTVLVLFYDILIYSTNWKDHIEHLREVFSILQQHKLFLKQTKCCFGTNRVEYLGHIIAEGTISMDPSKVKSIKEWPVPKSLKELRGFLGLSGYYRRFIKNYGVIA